MIESSADMPKATLRFLTATLVLFPCLHQGIAHAQSPYGTAPSIIALLANQQSFDVIPRTDDTGVSFFNENPLLPDSFRTFSIWDLLDRESSNSDGSAFGAGVHLWNLIPRASQ